MTDAATEQSGTVRSPSLVGVAAALVIVALVAPIVPAATIWTAARQGGLEPGQQADLLVASVALGVGAAVLAGRRVTQQLRVARRRTDVWLAAALSAVVVVLTSTGIPLLVFGGPVDQHVWLVEQGWPVVLWWLAAQAVAIAAAEWIGRVTFRWLDAAPA